MIKFYNNIKLLDRIKPYTTILKLNSSLNLTFSLNISCFLAISLIQSEIGHRAEKFKVELRDRLSSHGGMDVQEALPYGSPDTVQQGARRFAGILHDPKQFPRLEGLCGVIRRN